MDFVESVVHLAPLPSLLKHYPRLPAGYAFKGGAAREALFSALEQSYDLPRDWDIVRESHVGSEEQDIILAGNFCPEDLAYGNGVEVVSSFAECFNDRDFTINEALLIGEKLIASERAVNDVTARVLRILDQYNASKLTAKAWRFKAELGEEWRIEGALPGYEVSSFHIALHLSRCDSIASAATYCRTAIEQQGIVGVDPNLPGQDLVRCVIEILASDLFEGEEFFYGCAVEEVLDREVELWSEWEDTIAFLPHSRSLRRNRWC